MSTTLESQRRGATFRYRFPILGGWVWSQFSEIYFTLRSTVPPSTEVTDTAAIAQASKTGGEVYVDPDDDAFFWVEFPSATTNSWPLGQLLWDIEGTRDSDGSVDPLDEGDIEITADMTRRN
jgi:hypothetical protein